MTTPPAPEGTPSSPDRRDFLSRSTSLVMVGGLAAGYGTLGYMVGEYLYPSEPRKLIWVFVGEAASVRPGEITKFRTPAGQTVMLSRQGKSAEIADFLALSTTCPHLGCQVHWEPQNQRFFCPCHNGAFDTSGKATAGPPKDANQALLPYALRIENGLLFIQVPAEAMG